MINRLGGDLTNIAESLLNDYIDYSKDDSSIDETALQLFEAIGDGYSLCITDVVPVESDAFADSIIEMKVNTGKRLRQKLPSLKLTVSWKKHDLVNYISKIIKEGLYKAGDLWKETKW